MSVVFSDVTAVRSTNITWHLACGLWSPSPPTPHSSSTLIAHKAGDPSLVMLDRPAISDWATPGMKQRGPLSLVEKCRGLALIGRECCCAISLMP